ncbi:cardiolipin synthase [Paraburkholderia bonniea]|uniref:cardiolipin synthase n=1 Tax=Paraburkholderia bonniea TaxID=2152891 RepID=UPI0025732020|nr:cardiolipin synthase [Paraburkholderia bonniea]WJF89224.1 cardiolipin synthase [Paraburkholderia bonniea]WJF92540.1 cardiolipin synthase [Paraburkholderia bonniea]
MQFDLIHLAPLVALAHLLGAVAACHAILHTRTSQGAVAWAVALVTVPYLTLVPYLFLGRSRFTGYDDSRTIGRESLRSQRHQDEWATRISTYGQPAADLGHPLVRSLTRLAGMPFLSGNSVRTLVNGEATFEAIFAAIAQAQNYVIVQFFIVRADALGDRLKHALLERAAHGVKVYLLYDSIGSFDLPHRYIAALRAGGVETHSFSTRRFVNRFQLNFRNHRKIVVVDGERAFVGGLNVGVEYLGAKPPLSPWRDTHIEVRGPAVAGIQMIFKEDWYWATQQQLGFATAKAPDIAAATAATVATPAAANASDHMHCLVMASGPADRQETASLFLVEAIHAARERIWLTSPYLVPDEAVFTALRLAVLRGVDVRILIPSRRDHVVVFEASTLYAFDCVRAGVRIFRYQPGFLHQKVVLIDSLAAAIGSANLDNRSLRLNFEIMLLTVDRDFAAEVETMLLHDFSLAREIDADEYLKAPAWRRMGMHLARLFAPIL